MTIHISSFDLFLFDFDGLLVNTEILHFRAYKETLASYGIPFDWSFDRYCSAAHYGAHNLEESLRQQFPAMPSWREIYQKKQARMQELLQENIPLMEGAQELLQGLQKRGLPHAVVTHSPEAFVLLAKSQHPVLASIPHWITRHDYEKPKPDPECYLLAISRLAKPTDRVVGFEDSPRGLTALLGTRAQPVLVCQINYPEIDSFLKKGAYRLLSLKEVIYN